VGRTALAGLPKVKVIVRTGVGYDSVDVAAATERKVLVCNVPDYCIVDVAEHTMALLLSLWRRIGELDQIVRTQGWGLPIKPVYRLEGKILGLLGLGRMGQAVAARAKGFGVQLMAFDPYVPAAVFAKFGVRPGSLEDVLRTADIVSVHSPLSAETRGLICERTLRLMKPSAVLVNTARGGLVKTDDLARAVEAGWIAGAALDVVEVEPLPKDHPIRNLSRVLLTPHVAWYSEESEPELRRRSGAITAAVLRGDRIASILNPEALGGR
jgi:D-3-phosphoglycerate dehydrogenase / 2-oxoglutarate reductase